MIRFPKKMKESYLGFYLLLCLISFTLADRTEGCPDDLNMKAFRNSLGNPKFLGWTDDIDSCSWRYVTCWNNSVTGIQINSLNLTGTLPQELNNIKSLTVLEVANNQLGGQLPNLSRLRSLRRVRFENNRFSSIPSDFFKGLTSLQFINLDFNPFLSWGLPESLKEATGLEFFSAVSANISGTIPDFFGGDTFPNLKHLYLARNNLQGQIPSSFAKSSIQTLWLNRQISHSKLGGSLAVLQNMTSLTDVRLQFNFFTGPLPNLSRVRGLKKLNLGGNQLTGTVPLSLVNLPALTTVRLTNNLLQGPTPKFNNSKVRVHLITKSNSFCLDDPGAACDSRVNILLSIAESMGYPMVFAQSWQGNDPCDTSQTWKGIACDESNITVVNFQNMGLCGTIPSTFSMLKSLKELILSGNLFTGTIPTELTNLTNLVKLDVSNNDLYGKLPNFRPNLNVIIHGNPGIIVKDNNGSSPSISLPGTPDNRDVPRTPPDNSGEKKSNGRNFRKIILTVVGASCGALIISVGLSIFFYNRKRKNSKYWNFLRIVTNNFSEKNILGRGGFGTVYKGELHDGTKIAVKRMKSGVVSEQGFAEFKSEIEVLTKVRHRHLVALLGYCLDGNERLLVYEYMPQGTLSRHLFNWKEEGLEPLDWTKRLTIALDVARGLEYLHGLAHQSFIHRDLKPSNTLLGNDMRAKVADFGLARLVPEKGIHSIETRLVGTFGYLAPEYIDTGRVTKKVDVFSFGVVLMELITGRKAIDSTLPEDMVYIVPWFRRMYSRRNTFRQTIDQTIEVDEENLASISTVAELANHCCTSHPCWRPDMNHIVNVLSSLAELWRPVEPAGL